MHEILDGFLVFSTTEPFHRVSGLRSQTCAEDKSSGVENASKMYKTFLKTSDLPQVDSLIFLVMARCIGTIKI